MVRLIFRRDHLVWINRGSGGISGVFRGRAARQPADSAFRLSPDYREVEVVYLPPAFTESRSEVLIAHIERHDFGLLVSQGETARPPAMCRFWSSAATAVAAAGASGAAQPAARRTRPRRRGAGDLPGAARLCVAELVPGGAGGADLELRRGARLRRGPHDRRSRTGCATCCGGCRRGTRRASRRRWRMEDLPEPYVASMLKGIVGVEIEVTPARRQVQAEPEPPGGGPAAHRRRAGAPRRSETRATSRR